MRNKIQSRLIKFTALCISIRKHIKSSFEGDHLSKQLIRSASSAALNYSEAQSAESKNDFIHKQSISLKELRESYINLLIIKEAKIYKLTDVIDQAIDEAD